MTNFNGKVVKDVLKYYNEAEHECVAIYFMDGTILSIESSAPSGAGENTVYLDDGLRIPMKTLVIK